MWCFLLGHDWEYFRNNSIIVRSCKNKNCTRVDQTIYIEDPELIATAKTILPKTLKWKRVKDYKHKE